MKNKTINNEDLHRIWDKDSKQYIEDVSQYSIDPKTAELKDDKDGRLVLERNTRLKDINVINMFDGDIIEIWQFGGIELYRVFSIGYAALFLNESRMEDSRDHRFFIYKFTCRIVGNIHKDMESYPELSDENLEKIYKGVEKESSRIFFSND